MSTAFLYFENYYVTTTPISVTLLLHEKKKQSLLMQLLLAAWNNSIRKDCLKSTSVLILLFLSCGLFSFGMWKLIWTFIFFKCII